MRFSNTYEHTRSFDTLTDQTNYYSGKIKHRYEDFTYQRDDQSIKVPAALDDLYDCNYLMYKNPQFNNKYFYAFITRKEYVNPYTTKLYIELDVLQSFLFDFTPQYCFVEREHRDRWDVNGDPVINTLDEGIHYGDEYDIVDIQQYVPHDDIFFLVIVCKERMDVNGAGKIDPIINALPQPLTYYIHPFRLDGTIPLSSQGGNTINLTAIETVLLNLYSMEGAQNNIAALYITEHIGVNLQTVNGKLEFSSTIFEHVTVQDANFTMNTLRLKKKTYYENMSKSYGNKYTGFRTEKESKLMMYPYKVIVLSDLKGNQQVIKPEYIKSPDLVISAKGSMGTANKTSFHVRNYLVNENLPNANEIGIENGIINNSPNDIPIITDLLSAYLQGNRNQLANQKTGIQFNQLTGLAGSIMGRDFLGGITGVGNKYLEMQGLVAKQQDIDNTPPQINSMGGNTYYDYGTGIKGLYIIKKEITAEYQRKLEDYFEMYGYKINVKKVPEWKTRKYFNYIKTVGMNVQGDVSTEYRIKINEIFDKGITFWHDTTVSVGNYGYSDQNIEV